MGTLPLAVRRENFGVLHTFSKGGKLKKKTILMNESLFKKGIDTHYLKHFQNECQK